MCPLILWTAKLTVRKQKPFSTTFDVHRDTNQHTSSYTTTELKEVTDGCFFPQNRNVVYCKYIHALVIIWDSSYLNVNKKHKKTCSGQRVQRAHCVERYCGLLRPKAMIKQGFLGHMIMQTFTKKRMERNQSPSSLCCPWWRFWKKNGNCMHLKVRQLRLNCMWGRDATSSRLCKP